MSKRRRRNILTVRNDDQQYGQFRTVKLPPKTATKEVLVPTSGDSQSSIRPVSKEQAATAPMAEPQRAKWLTWVAGLWHAVKGPLAAPLAIFLGSRLAIFVLIAFFVGLFPTTPDKKPDLMHALTSWDGGWYYGIIINGYQWQGPGQASNLAFWPLFPMLGKLVGFLLGSPQWGMIAVANVSFAVYLVYLYKLASWDLDQGSGYRAVLYVSLFPLSFIYSCAYTESTLLALSVTAFYYARRGNWRAAIPLGLFATLTRLAGIVILLPLAWEFYKQRGLTWRALALLIVPLGTLGYALYAWRLSGDPFTILTAASVGWSRHFTWPWETVRIGLDVLARVPLTQYVVSIAIVDVSTIILFLVLSFAALRWMKPSYWIYAIPATLLAISNTLDPKAGLPTASLARYLLAVFPGFMLLGKVGKNSYVHHILVFLFAVLLGVLSIYFFSIIWVA